MTDTTIDTVQEDANRIIELITNAVDADSTFLEAEEVLKASASYKACSRRKKASKEAFESLTEELESLTKADLPKGRKRYKKTDVDEAYNAYIKKTAVEQYKLAKGANDIVKPKSKTARWSHNHSNFKSRLVKAVLKQQGASGAEVTRAKKVLENISASADLSSDVLEKIKADLTLAKDLLGKMIKTAKDREIEAKKVQADKQK